MLSFTHGTQLFSKPDLVNQQMAPVPYPGIVAATQTDLPDDPSAIAKFSFRSHSPPAANSTNRRDIFYWKR
jgi:hypothetical protein